MNSPRSPLLLACAAIAGLEGLAIAVIMIVNLAGALHQGKYNAGLLVGVELLFLLAVVALAFIARGLVRRSPSSRTPFALTQLFALPIAFQLIRHGGPWLVPGVVLAVAALSGLLMVFSPRGGAEFN